MRDCGKFLELSAGLVILSPQRVLHDFSGWQKRFGNRGWDAHFLVARASHAISQAFIELGLSCPSSHCGCPSLTGRIWNTRKWIFPTQDQTRVFHITDRFFTVWATMEAHDWAKFIVLKITVVQNLQSFLFREKKRSQWFKTENHYR